MAALAIVSQLFMLWMLVDAVQRRMDTYWYVIILMPFGEWAYFFVVKINDYDLTTLRRFFFLDRPPPVDDLRHLVEQTPSVENQLKLADALRTVGHHGEAEPLYRAVLARDADDTDAIYGLAICRLGDTDPQGAIDALGRLLDLDPAYHDWAAWPTLSFAYGCADKPSESVAVLRKLVEKAPRISHKVMLGKGLVRAGKTEEAATLLREAIADYRYAQGFVKRSNGRWAREARLALRDLPT